MSVLISLYLATGFLLGSYAALSPEHFIRESAQHSISDKELHIIRIVVFIVLLFLWLPTLMAFAYYRD